MSFDEAKKDMTRAEKALAKIRTARTELEKSAADAQTKLDAALADREAALAAGRVGDLSRHGAVIENARLAIKATTDDLEAIQTAEHSALGDTVRAEKAAQDALKAEWDILADAAKAELAAVAGPLLRKFWMAAYHSNYPSPLGECLRSASIGLRQDIDDAAQAAPDPAFPLPEHVESALLSHGDRNKFQRHVYG